MLWNKSATCGQSGCCWYENCSASATEPNDELSAELVDGDSTITEHLPSNYTLQEAVQLAFHNFASSNFSGARAICNRLLADKVENFYVYYLSGIVAYQINDWVLPARIYPKHRLKEHRYLLSKT